MSDSDSTIPAVDDFGSRFLEIDEFVNDTSKAKGVSKSKTTQSSRTSIQKRTVEAVTSLFKRSTRTVKQPRLYATLDEDAAADWPVADGGLSHAVDSHVDQHADEQATIHRQRPKKLLTARQLSLQAQRNSTSIDASNTLHPDQTTLDAPTESLSNGLLTLESLHPPKIPSVPTPEQLAVRQKRIARRRETAKHKAEMEKQQTVQKLLKVNIHASGARKRGRGGRAFRPTLSGATTDPTRPETPQSDYSDQLNESDGAVNAPTSADEAEPSECVASTVRTALSERNNIPRSRLDPPQGYVRMVSSTHLDPSRNICFPANSSALVDLLKWSSTLDNATDRLRTTRTAQFCALSCGRFKRYTCAKTGLPLCSLGCYRNNLARVEANKTAVGGV